jgi:hypothetical protein
MEKDPYKYSFPVLEDNMRNASKVTLRECGGGSFNYTYNNFSKNQKQVVSTTGPKDPNCQLCRTVSTYYPKQIVSPFGDALKTVE